MTDHKSIEGAHEEIVIEDAAGLAEAAEGLSSSSRWVRQHSASAISAYVQEHPESAAPYAPQLIAALGVKEGRTRWECLDVLSVVVGYDSRACDKALAGAEEALFDEGNGFVRLSALRFLCVYGATTEKRSEKVWPAIEEAIQCYHGNAEFQDMLTVLVTFSEGKLSPSVKEAFAKRVSFDAQNNKGSLGRRMRQIAENLK